jgi:hypothetical protein
LGRSWTETVKRRFFMRTRLLTLTCCILASAVLARADEPAGPKPGPEHDMLKMCVGEWDAVVEVQGLPPSKGSAVYKMELGGFWLTEAYTGEFGGQKFEGRGLTGYDPIKKKYVSTGIDSMDPNVMLMEGAFDKDGKTLALIGDGYGDDGKPAKMKSVTEFPDKDTLVFTFYTVADGKDQQMMKITYKRKK